MMLFKLEYDGLEFMFLSLVLVVSVKIKDPLIFKLVKCRREKCKKESKESEKKCICECSYMNLNCLSLLEYLYGDKGIYKL